MDSGKRKNITFKPSRLAKVLESNVRNEMTKKSDKSRAATGAAQLADADRRGDICSFLQAAAGLQATEDVQTTTLGKRKATMPRDQPAAKRTIQGYKEEDWEANNLMVNMRNNVMDKSKTGAMIMPR